MKSLFCLVISLAAFGAPSLAQSRHLDARNFREYLTKEYVTEFVKEFNSYNMKDAKDIYGFFVPKKDRAAFLKSIKVKPRISGEKNFIYFKVAGRPTIKVEILDVLGQRYKMNGKTFAFDWNGDMETQLNSIRGRFKASEDLNGSLTPLLDLLMPKAEALTTKQKVLVGVGAAAGLAAACYFGVCEWIALMGARAALSMVAKRGFVSMAASQMDRDAAQQALVDLGRATRSSQSVLTRIYEELYTNPGINKGLAIVGRGASAAVKALRAMSKVVFVQQATGTGIAVLAGQWVFASNQEKSAAVDDAVKRGMDKEIATKCVNDNYKPDDTCPFAKPKFPKMIAPPAEQFVPPTCPSSMVNEFQTYVERGKTTVALFTRTDPKFNPISAVRFEIVNGRVDLNSVRNYTIKDDTIVEIKKPGYVVESVSAEPIETQKKHFNGPDAAKKQDEDLKNQIIQRDKILDSYRDKSEDQIIWPTKSEHGDILKEYKIDHLKAESDPKAKEMDKEYNEALGVKTMIDAGVNYCNYVNSLVEASAKAKAETGGTPATK